MGSAPTGPGVKAGQHPRPGAATDILAPPRFVLRPSEVHLWWVSTEVLGGSLAHFEAVLDSVERERAGRFVFTRDRERSIVARGALRRLLAAYGCGPPEDLRFRLGVHGKPSLADRGPSFNLSHSGAIVLFAITAPETEIGVDIEQTRRVADMERMARRFFSAAEHAAWRALPPSHRDLAFFRLWTRKEAFVKATGEGLTRPLDSFTVSLGDPVEIVSPRLDGWSLRHVEPLAGYVGALAVACPDPTTLAMGELVLTEGARGPKELQFRKSCVRAAGPVFDATIGQRDQ